MVNNFLLRINETEWGELDQFVNLLKAILVSLTRIRKWMITGTDILLLVNTHVTCPNTLLPHPTVAGSHTHTLLQSVASIQNITNIMMCCASHPYCTSCISNCTPRSKLSELSHCLHFQCCQQVWLPNFPRIAFWNSLLVSQIPCYMDKQWRLFLIVLSRNIPIYSC